MHRPPCTRHPVQVEDSEAHRLIVTRVRAGLERMALEHEAEFVDASADARPDGAPALAYRLVPRAEGAARLEVLPDDAYSTYIDVGEGGWIEVFTNPKSPETDADEVLRVVSAVVAGRLRETVWTKKKSRAHVDSLLHIQYESGGPWRLIGEVGRPLPLLRRWLYDERQIEYRPYRQ